MNKKVLMILLIILVIIVLVTICILKNNGKNITNSNNVIINSVTKNIVENSNVINNNSVDKESGEIMNTTNIKVNIDSKIYTATLEQNETTKQFINMLPKEFKMSELNGNEKYVYLDFTLPTNSYNPKHIEAGDIMLYGNDCLVVFYKSFDTSYSYTKIGHIENLNELGNKNVSIKFEK